MAKKRKPAVYFLAIMAGLTFIAVAAISVFNFFPWTVMGWAYVPNTDFAEQSPPAKPDYSQTSSWFSLPGTPGETAMRPAGLNGNGVMLDADVFFIHPTTYLKNKSWNGPINDPDADKRSRLMVMKNQASAFNVAGRVIAPRYRQATFGAFLAIPDGGLQAIIQANQDVLDAFDTYMTDMNNGRPFIIAGHSQGALQGLLLLQSRIAGTPLAKQMVAAYLVGWPIGKESDIGQLEGIDVCTRENDTGCVVSWQSFAADGDPAYLRASFEAVAGLDNEPRAASDILCTNPLTWTIDGSADASKNLGAVAIFENEEPLAAPEINLTGATCKGGFLFLDKTPKHVPWQSMLLPNQNYHVHDINLFYMNVRFNAAKRVRSFVAAQQTAIAN